MAKGLLVKKNDKVVLKASFVGNEGSGIVAEKANLESLNPAVTFVYEEYDIDNASFTSAIIDEAEQATLNRGF